ncbi:MAG: hypothetical protein AAF352_03240 [Pseudomonadota bacterium]
MKKRTPKESADLLPEGVLIEFVPEGDQVRVFAIDPHSKLEVSIIGSIEAPQKSLENQAVWRLRHMLRIRHQKASGSNDSDEVQTKRSKRYPELSGWDL